MPSRASRGRGVLRVEGRTALIANIYAAKRNVKREMQQATVRNGADTVDLAFQLAPKDTWFMANHIKVEYTPDRLGFDVFLDPQDFAAAGLPYYPPYVELGTSVNPAQPFLGPAFAAMEPVYQADISRAIRRALRESTT